MHVLSIVIKPQIKCLCSNKLRQQSQKLAAISIRGSRGGLAVSRIKKSRVCIYDFFQEIPQFYKVFGVRALIKAQTVSIIQGQSRIARVRNNLVWSKSFTNWWKWIAPFKWALSFSQLIAWNYWNLQRLFKMDILTLRCHWISQQQVERIRQNW